MPAVFYVHATLSMSLLKSRFDCRCRQEPGAAATERKPLRASRWDSTQGLLDGLHRLPVQPWERPEYL